MSKILKNQTGSIVSISDVGQSVPASGQLTIDPSDYDKYAQSSETIVYIGAGTLVVNDGSFDLSITEGTDLIKGLFPRDIIIKGEMDDTSTVAATEGNSAAVRITPQRAAHTNLRNQAGTEIGTSSNPLRSDPTGTTTQPVSAASLPLPAGASTSANQTTQNASLSSIDSKTPALGQAAMAASQPVVIASNQTPVSVSGTFWQTTQPVSGTFWQATQPISAVSLPLPTGASTSAKQDTANTSLASIDGKITAVNTGATVIASSALPTGAATSANQTTEISSLQILDDVPSAMNAAFSKGSPSMGQLDDTSTTAATEDNVAPVRITPQRAQHVNFRNQSGTEIGTSTTPVRTDPTGTTTQPVSGTVSVGNFPATQPVSGTVAVSSLPALPAGSNAIGSVSVSNFPATQAISAASLPLPSGAATAANQATGIASLSSIDTKTPALGQAAMAASSPVVIASNQTAIPVSGTVTSNIGTTNGLALDATLTGGSQKSILRGAAKGTTVAGDATTTPVDANTQALDVSVKNFPATQAVSGTVSVGNFPATQPVSGTVAVSSLPSIPAGANAIGSVSVSNFPATQPVSASSLPLPTGAATAANQATEISSLSSIDTKLSSQATAANQTTEIASLQILDDVPTAMNGAFVKANPAAGQLDDTTTTAATEDNVAPVRITPQRAFHTNLRNQAGTEIGTSATPVRFDPTGTTTQPVSAASLPLPTGAATAANQSTEIASLASIDTKTPALVSGRQPVDGSGVTQPVSVASLPLPTGAATSANQTTEITSLQLLDDIVHAQNATLNKGVPLMGQLDDTSTTAATEDAIAVARITAQRAIHTNLRNVSGTEIGTSANPVRTDPTGTTSQPTKDVITASINGVISVTTTAAEAKIGVSALTNRKFITITPTTGVIYWGSSSSVTVANGTPIFKNMSVTLSFTNAAPVYLIAASTINTRLVEGS